MIEGASVYNREIEFTNEPDHVEYKPHVNSISFKEIKWVTNNNVLYFPGTLENPGSKSTKELKQSLADYSGNTSFSFRSSENIENILKFIEDRKLDNIELWGYSQGSIKAMEVAKKLEENGVIKLSGVVLLEPTSLYKQKNLFWKFISEPLRAGKSFGEYKKLNRKEKSETFKNGRYILKEVFGIGIQKLIGIKNKNKLSLRKQIKNMSLINPNLDEIKAPIVIIQGKNDKVSNPEMTDPKIFLKSDKVYQIVPKNLGTHFLPVLRSEKIAKVGLGLLDIGW